MNGTDSRPSFVKLQVIQVHCSSGAEPSSPDTPVNPSLEGSNGDIHVANGLVWTVPLLTSNFCAYSRKLPSTRSRWTPKAGGGRYKQKCLWQGCQSQAYKDVFTASSAYTYRRWPGYVFLTLLCTPTIQQPAQTLSICPLDSASWNL